MVWLGNVNIIFPKSHLFRSRNLRKKMTWAQQRKKINGFEWIFRNRNRPDLRRFDGIKSEFEYLGIDIGTKTDQSTK